MIMKVYNLTNNIYQPGKKENKLHKNMDDLQNWLWILGKTNKKDFKILNQINPGYNFSHHGLIHYLYGCWAKELNCVLSPEIFFHRYLSELIKYILQYPSDFEPLFDLKQNGKKRIYYFVGKPNHKNIANDIAKLMKNKKLYHAICKANFSTDTDTSKKVRNLSFLNMTIPYVDYIKTFCGIPNVLVDGTENDWKHLLENIYLIMSSIEDHNLKNNKSCHEFYQYSKKVANLILAILHFSFDNQKYKISSKYQQYNDIDFYNNMFYFENKQCMSGHDENRIGGWINILYNKDEGLNELVKYNHDISYLPYYDETSKRRFITMGGMTHSIIKNNTAYPSFQVLELEILNSDLFEDIKNGVKIK